MISPFSIFQTPQDVIPYTDDNEKLILPICDNIVFALGKCLDPVEDSYIVYNRNQATVIGLFVKQYELFQSFISASRNGDTAATIIFFRIIYEAYIKMRYLIKYGENAQKEYRLCSYTNRYKFYLAHKDEDNPVAKISITKFISDIKEEDFTIDDIEEVVTKKKKNFGGKTFAQLVEEFDQKEFYNAVYGYLSDSIHSDWGEARQLYLQTTENFSFVYNPEKDIKIPLRELTAISQVMLESSFAYFDWFEAIDNKFPIIGIMKSLLKEMQRVISLIMVNIANDYKSDKFLYE
jgi:hypothetical protein